MYLIGVVLARYYNWWLEKTSRHPRRWVLFFCVVNTLVLISLSFSGVFWIAIYGLTAVFLVPAFFAACKNEALQGERGYDDWRKIKKMNRLLKDYPRK